MDKIYDVAIIGGGPGGLAAGLYASRGRMSAVIIEKGKWGGQAATTEELENYPGSIEHPTGPSLTARMKSQAEAFGTEFIKDEVVGFDLSDKVKVLKLKEGEIKAKSIIIASGAQHVNLGAPGEDDFRGKGVSYCATCDADFFAELEVVVVGGGDAAVEEALYLTKFADKVSIVHRRNEFRAAKSIVEKALDNEKIQIIWDSVVEEIYGDGIVEGVKLKNVKTGEITDYRTDGVFVFVGTKPVSEFAKGIVDMDEKGYIIADAEMKTSAEGIFAAGDVRVTPLRQVITAAADGAVAAISAEKYIERTFNK
ncbi:thioredoxin-disulfide reductase [Lutispora sp.]|uniref:thioredoxin-disulfide reductase n=1 Tax=Lutispora sp. TaxID=2828727 RepID=UPI002B2068FA|nr:thioredoxin-disulfide reductase [Lutispora sp.]MEA4960202.1 thioredoxin-disulfide reductase [Lutispora sp.]